MSERRSRLIEQDSTLFKFLSEDEPISDVFSLDDGSNFDSRDELVDSERSTHPWGKSGRFNFNGKPISRQGWNNLLEAMSAIHSGGKVSDSIVPIAIFVKKSNGKTYAFDSFPMVIGRNKACEFPVGGDGVSRNHARLEYANGEFVISDLGSLNGVVVNGIRSPKKRLEDGDEVKLGKVHLVFHQRDELAASETAEASGGRTGGGKKARSAVQDNHSRSRRYEQSDSDDDEALANIGREEDARSSPLMAALLSAVILVLLLTGGFFIYELMFNDPAVSSEIAAPPPMMEEDEKRKKPMIKTHASEVQKELINSKGIEVGDADQSSGIVIDDVGDPFAMEPVDLQIIPDDAPMGDDPAIEIEARVTNNTIPALDSAVQDVQSARDRKDTAELKAMEDKGMAFSEKLRNPDGMRDVAGFTNTVGPAVPRLANTFLTLPRVNKKARSKSGSASRGAPTTSRKSFDDEAKRLLRKADRVYRQGNGWGIHAELLEMKKEDRLSDSVKRSVHKKYSEINTLMGLYSAGEKAFKKGDKRTAFAQWVNFMEKERAYFGENNSKYADKVNEKVVGEYLNRADSAYRAGRYVEAYGIWEKALELDKSGAASRKIAEIENKAAQLYEQGLQQETVNPAAAQRLWEEVLRWVPPGNAYHTKASGKLTWLEQMSR